MLIFFSENVRLSISDLVLNNKEKLSDSVAKASEGID